MTAPDPAPGTAAGDSRAASRADRVSVAIGDERRLLEPLPI
ncbi:MAG TPA: hypothetical protein VIK04_19515 [Solirubrobacteraceae bacterium]